MTDFFNIHHKYCGNCVITICGEESVVSKKTINEIVLFNGGFFIEI